jgi:signal transduction histidine kinase
VDLGQGARSLLVAPVYEADPAVGVPATASARRAATSGWVVAVIDLGALAASYAPAEAEVRVADQEATLARQGSGTGPLAVRSLDIEGRSLRVAAGVPEHSGIAAPTVWFLIAGAVLGPLAAALVLVAAARYRAQRATAERQGAQVRLIGEVAPLVQQSLDLSEVLPAVAVQLTDHFGLAGVSLSTGSSRGGQTELFSIGAGPAQPANPVLQPPAALAAGETLTLALQRGGRSVALLQVVAGRPLDGSELESLRALTELVTAAMVNASLYASQQEALQRLRELDGLKTVFLGTASHELRTPATAIAGFASLLTDSWDRFSEEQRLDFAGRIAANARSLSAVVQDLLDFSLLDRGGLSVSLEAVDLGSLVESVVDRLGPALGDRVIRCTTAPAPAVSGDRNGLERITTNLLTNAVKFSPAGSAITVVVEPAGDGAALIVSDEGPGVPPEEREQVFTRFYRGSGEAVVQTRGVGIGLSLVAEFTARMHGEVTVDDAPGGGARFTVRLPAASLADQED